MNSTLKVITSFLLGSLAVGGFHPFELWFMPLVSVIGLIAVIQKATLRIRLVACYFYGAGFLLPLLHWSSTYVGSMPWLVLSLSFAMFYMPLAFGFVANHVAVFRFPLIFLIAEGMRAIAPFGGFGWGRFGFSQLDGPLENWLRIGGVSLTGFIVALVAASVVARGRRLFLLLPIASFGVFSTVPASAQSIALSEQTPVRIGLIQGGVSQLGLDFNATPQEVLNRHISESERLLKRQEVDLILWPENASDIDPLSDVKVKERIDALIGRYGAPFVIGAVTQSPEGPENVSISLDGQREARSIYQKRDLVPFGEYIPLRRITERVSPLASTIRDFVPGEGIATHTVSGLTFAPLICYEVLDDRVTWENLSRSTVGVVQTNNATFGRSWQSGQQFQMTRVRAFESQVPFVVAATTGDTALIDRDGRVAERLEKYRPAHLVAVVWPSTPRIPLLGPELLLLLALASLLVMFGWERTRGRREAHRGMI